MRQKIVKPENLIKIPKPLSLPQLVEKQMIEWGYIDPKHDVASGYGAVLRPATRTGYRKVTVFLTKITGNSRVTFRGKCAVCGWKVQEICYHNHRPYAILQIKNDKSRN